MIGFRARFAHILSDSGPKLFKDLISLLSGQATSMIIGFVTFAYLARVLKPTDYGAVEFAISIAAFAAIIIECGAGTIGVRELARREQDSGKIAAQITIARLLLTIVVLPLAGVAVWASGQPEAIQTLVWVYAFSLLAVPFKQEWMLQGFGKMHAAAVAQPIRMTVFAVGVFAFVGTDTPMLAVGVIELFAVAAVTAYYLMAQWRWCAPFHFGWKLSDAVFFLREGLSVGLSNMLWAFMLYAPMFLLVAMVGGTEPAWLGATNRIVISLMTLSFIYHFNLYPVVTRTVTADPETWARLMRASARLVAWAGIGLALAVSLLAPDLMGFTFGPEFTAAAPAISVMIWMFPLRSLSGHGRWSLIAAGHQRYLLVGEIAGATSLVFVGLLAIPTMGAAGAALGLLCGISVSGIATQIAANRLVGPMAMVPAVALPLATAAIAWIVSLWITEPGLVRGLTGGCLYGAVLVSQFRPLLRDLQRLGYANTRSP
jgi:O-antigen/teichoic acid export membrane protein